jgi:hypothetical protein
VETRKPTPRAMITIPKALKHFISSANICPITMRERPNAERMTPLESEERIFSLGARPLNFKKLRNLSPSLDCRKSLNSCALENF